MPTPRTISFRIDSDKVAQLDVIAKAMNRDRSYLLNEAVENYLCEQRRFIAMVEEGLDFFTAASLIPREVIFTTHTPVPAGHDRFSASLVIVLSLAWLGSGTGGTGRWLRRMGFSLLPETGGRGLWGGITRRRVIEQIVNEGDPGALVGAGTGLVIGALSLDRGRMTHFVSWPDPSLEFRARVKRELGEVVSLSTPADAMLTPGNSRTSPTSRLAAITRNDSRKFSATVSNVTKFSIAQLGEGARVTPQMELPLLDRAGLSVRLAGSAPASAASLPVGLSGNESG